MCAEIWHGFTACTSLAWCMNAIERSIPLCQTFAVNSNDLISYDLLFQDDDEPGTKYLLAVSLGP